MVPTNNLMPTIRYLAKGRVSPKYVRTFYDLWKQCSGYRNPLEPWRYHFAGAKDRIVDHMLRRAAKFGWLVWRQKFVLYVETPVGQISWHMVKPSHIPGCQTPIPKCFLKFTERFDLQWSGIRNSDEIIIQCLGKGNMAIRAKFSGTCADCGGRILRGSTINWDRGTNRMVHANRVYCETHKKKKAGK